MPRYIIFVVTSCLFLLAGCQTGTAASGLPTRAGVAALPTAVPLPTLTNTPNVPPTWTPAPADNSGAVLSVSPPPQQERPSPVNDTDPVATVFIPTRTPRPPTITPTPLPTNTPTPYVSFIPIQIDTSELGPSKMGIHVVRNNPDVMNFVRRYQPPLVKGVDDLGFLDEVRQAAPNAIIIGRLNNADQGYYGVPEERAREYVLANIDEYRLHPAVDYWEGWNEPDPGFGRMSWYARYEQERVKLMAQYGLKSAIGGFPPGVPEMNEFALFLPAIETAKQHQGILTLHEGDISTGDLRNLMGVPFPGYPAYPDRGLMSLRYRWFYREFLEPNDLVIPLVISELEFVGWDAGVPLSYEYLVNQFAWYDAEVRKDGYVIGFNIFTAGPIGYWKNFNIDPFLPQIGQYIQSQR